MNAMEPYQQLEEEIARWMELPSGSVVACSSGTAALHLALESLQLPLGSEVILGDFNMIACARAVILAGLVPVFIDCLPHDSSIGALTLDPALIGTAITDRTRAILCTHIYGRQCRMEEIHMVASRRCLSVVEDMAEIHGVRPHPKTDVACWSFYKNKIVAGEEGGALSFQTYTKYRTELARSLRSLGFTPVHNFYHLPRGHNYRMSNLHASFIRGEGVVVHNGNSLRHYTRNVIVRREMEKWYSNWCPEEWKMPKRNAVWVYDVRIPGITVHNQMEVVYNLNKGGIQARCSFQPMSRQQEFISLRCRVIGYPGTTLMSDKACKELLYLPVQPGVTTEDKCMQAISIILRTVYKDRPIHSYISVSGQPVTIRNN
jgi:perosamine synthetase